MNRRPPAFWSAPATDLLQQLGVTPQGLTSTAAGHAGEALLALLAVVVGRRLAFAESDSSGARSIGPARCSRRLW